MAPTRHARRRLARTCQHVVVAGGGGAAAEGRKAQIALIGAGWWARDWHLVHLQNHPGCDLVAIVDPSAELRAEFGEVYQVATFESIEALLEGGPQLDGVLISSPHKTHYDIGMKAIAAGLHVLIEKPMTTSAEEATSMVEAAAAGGQTFMVNTTANWREQTKRAVEYVEDGRCDTEAHSASECLHAE
jgi:predicted dehydrogenase